MADQLLKSTRNAHTDTCLDTLPTNLVQLIFETLSRSSWNDVFRLSRCNKILYKIGKRYLERCVGCINCLNPFCSADHAAAANSSSRSFSFYLEDGIAFCLGELDQLIPGAIDLDPEQEGFCKSRRLVRELRQQLGMKTDEELGLKVRHAHCSSCKLYLGVQVVQIKGLRCGDDLDMSSWRLGLVLGNIFVASKYMCVLNAAVDQQVREDTTLPGISWQDFKPSKLYACAMKTPAKPETSKPLESLEVSLEVCGNVLFDDRSILSTEHVWKPSRELSQNNEDENDNNNSFDSNTWAWYVNFIDPSAHVHLTPPEVMELVQGTMKIGRMYCSKCTGELGWKFIEGGEANVQFVGRWGVIEQCIQEVQQQDKQQRLVLPPRCRVYR